MNRQPVISSRIASVGYDLTGKTLEIEFKAWKKGVATRVYQYYDVDPTVYTVLMTTPDKGFYFEYVIKGKYEYKEIV